LARAIDWKPVPPEDLALKDNPKQPGADAMIREPEEEHVRIKVFTQAGVSPSHVNIEFVKEQESIPYLAAPDDSPGWQHREIRRPGGWRGVRLQDATRLM
jgi:hypothetical protein